MDKREEQKEDRQRLSELFPIEKSDLYARYLLEKEEINKLKWIISEQLGHDCGYQYAQWQWITHHRQNWLISLVSTGDASVQ